MDRDHNFNADIVIHLATQLFSLLHYFAVTITVFVSENLVVLKPSPVVVVGAAVVAAPGSVQVAVSYTTGLASTTVVH